MPLQPPLTQPRPNSAPLSHQFQPVMGPNMNYQHPGAQQMHHLQPAYNSSMKPPNSGVMGPPFPHGQPQFPNQHQPSQYQMTPDMEQMLQQVVRLTPEQINELSPEQRSHVLQLRQLFGQ